MAAYVYLGYDYGGDTPFQRRYLLEKLTAENGNLVSASVQDGWGDRDDTASVTISDSPGVTRYFYADIVLVILEASDGSRRLFGPFDIKTVDDQNAIGEYTFAAIADRWIERTVFGLIQTLQSQVRAILALAPYSTWLDDLTRDTIEAKVVTAIAAAKSLSDIRSALAKYDLTLVPDEILALPAEAPGTPLAPQVFRSDIPPARLVATQHLNRARRVKVATLAPLSETVMADEAGGGDYPTADLDPDSTAIAEIGTVAQLRHRAYARETLLATRIHTPDRYNAPGTYASRQIIVGFRQPNRGFNAIYSHPDPPSAEALPLFPVELDAVAANRALGAWAVNSARRNLQNSAARTSITIPEGDLTISPNSILAIESPAIPVFGTGEWRVEAVDHSTKGDTLESQASLILWQGESTSAASFPRVVTP